MKIDKFTFVYMFGIAFIAAGMGVTAHSRAIGGGMLFMLLLIIMFQVTENLLIRAERIIDKLIPPRRHPAKLAKEVTHD